MVAQSQQQRRQQQQQQQGPVERSQTAPGGVTSSSQSRRRSSSGVPPSDAASASQGPASTTNSRRLHDGYSPSVAAPSSSSDALPPSSPAAYASHDPRRSDSINCAIPLLSGTVPHDSHTGLERLADSLHSPSAASRRAAQVLAVAMAAGGEGSDERPQRLCKSLSKRSFARLASSHYRRVSRTKSRFALVKVRMLCASCHTVRGSPAALASPCPRRSVTSRSLPMP